MSKSMVEVVGVVAAEMPEMFNAGSSAMLSFGTFKTEIFIEMNNEVIYRYDVDANTVEEFLNATSKGSFHGSKLRGKVPTVQVVVV